MCSWGSSPEGLEIKRQLGVSLLGLLAKIKVYICSYQLNI
ncbi:unnamed protein product [Ixodes pacificus]